jgi:HD-GYP domain-containing protein (c-di-GMP phosphodiesterase class II)
VADSFDAMTSDRAYRAAMSYEEAVDELLRHSGTQFSPEIVQALIRGLERLRANDQLERALK